MKIVVIGGVAAGMSAASQARRRDPSAEVVVFERGPHVSYGACGIPYNLAHPARDVTDLVVRTPEEFRGQGITVHLQHEVTAFAPGRVQVRDRVGGAEWAVSCDHIVVATGAQAVRPALEGADQEGVVVMRELSDASELKRRLADRRPRAAVIVGGGYVGVEMAEALHARGCRVTLLERAEQLVPGFDPHLASMVRGELERNGVHVATGLSVRRIAPDRTVETDRGDFPADVVVLAVGVKPNVALAQAAGAGLGAGGAIAVDDQLRTNLPGVWAAGDCATTWHRVLRAPTWIPLGTTANKMGKIAGANATGAMLRFAGVVGSAGFKVYALEVARTGLSEVEARAAGFDAVTVGSAHSDRAGHWGPPAQLETVLVVERGTGRLLGAEMAGRGTVGKRIDVFATALTAGMDVGEIESLDLTYAPPFAPIYDPVLIAAGVARKAAMG